MRYPEVDEYIKRLTLHANRKLTALEEAVVAEFKCKPYWDPLEQRYRFTNAEGRKRRHWTKN